MKGKTLPRGIYAACNLENMILHGVISQGIRRWRFKFGGGEVFAPFLTKDPDPSGYSYKQGI